MRSKEDRKNEKKQWEETRNNDNMNTVAKTEEERKHRLYWNGENERAVRRDNASFMQTSVMDRLNDHRTYGTPLPIAEHCHNHLHWSVGSLLVIKNTWPTCCKLVFNLYDTCYHCILYQHWWYLGRVMHVSCRHYWIHSSQREKEIFTLFHVLGTIKFCCKSLFMRYWLSMPPLFSYVAIQAKQVTYSGCSWLRSISVRVSICSIVNVW